MMITNLLFIIIISIPNRFNTLVQFFECRKSRTPIIIKVKVKNTFFFFFTWIYLFIDFWIYQMLNHLKSSGRQKYNEIEFNRRLQVTGIFSFIFLSNLSILLLEAQFTERIKINRYDSRKASWNLSTEEDYKAGASLVSILSLRPPPPS